MTLKVEGELDILTVCLHTETEVASLRHSNFELLTVDEICMVNEKQTRKCRNYSCIATCSLALRSNSLELAHSLSRSLAHPVTRTRSRSPELLCIRSSTCWLALARTRWYMYKFLIPVCRNWLGFYYYRNLWPCMNAFNRSSHMSRAYIIGVQWRVVHVATWLRKNHICDWRLTRLIQNLVIFTKLDARLDNEVTQGTKRYKCAFLKIQDGERRLTWISNSL